MDMSKFWSQTVGTSGNIVPVNGTVMSLMDMEKHHPEELQSLLDDYGSSYPDNLPSFAVGPLPAFGPGGPTSDEDDNAFPDDEDMEMPSQTVSSLQGLMAYYSETDELYVWNEEEGEWMLWNY